MQLESSTLSCQFQTIERFLQDVICLVEKDKPCEELVFQLLALQCALESMLFVMIRYQVKHSLETLIKENCHEIQDLELRRLVSLYEAMPIVTSRIRIGIREIA